MESILKKTEYKDKSNFSNSKFNSLSVAPRLETKNKRVPKMDYS